MPSPLKATTAADVVEVCSPQAWIVSVEALELGVPREYINSISGMGPHYGVPTV